MTIHPSPFGAIFPFHIHECPVHPLGGAASSKACGWDEHDAAFQLMYKAPYDLAVASIYVVI